jgi:NADPH:quinone reductase-like Zn-dependent oxidoreductase
VHVHVWLMECGLRQAAGVNPVDFKLRMAKQTWYPAALPAIPGWDMSGVVEARGHAARRFEVRAPAQPCHTGLSAGGRWGMRSTRTLDGPRSA